MSRDLAPGAVLHEQKYFDDVYYWVTVDLSQRRITTIPSSDRYPSPYVEPIGRGIASAGGDFKCSDRSCHLAVIDREIWTTGTAVGTSYIASKGFAKVERTKWSVTLTGLLGSVYVNHVNAPGEGLNARTPRDNVRVPLKEYGLRLINPTTWESTGIGWGRSYTAHEAGHKVSGSHAVPQDEIELESDTPIPFTPGETVTWSQSFNDLRGVTDVISGMSHVVQGGVNIAKQQSGGSGDMARDGYYYDPCPRTVLGVSADGGTAYLVAVDGLPGNQAGVRFPRLGSFLTEVIGLDSAFNLDGGGSTVLWTKKFGVVSKPSEGYVRPRIAATVIF